MLREGQIPNEAAWFYSVSTTVYFPVFVFGLFMTNAYLLAGHNSYLPVYVFIIVSELLKYAYIQLVYHKDITYNPKQGFKLFSIILYFVKQIKVTELFRSGFILLLCTFFVFIMTIFFGAEVLDHHEQTLMFSCLIAVLTVFPVCLHQGVVSVMQLVNGIHGNDAFTQLLLRNIQFTVLGAWLGAFVIPLDWDREWQVFPIPCSFGAVLGFSTAQIISIVELYTKFSIGKLPKQNIKYR